MLELPLASSIRMYRNQHRRPRPPLAAPALEDLSEPGRIVAHKTTGYSGSIRTWHGSGLMISQCSGDGTSLYREAAHLGDSYDRYATMVLVHAGRFTGHQCGRAAIARAGDIITLLPREVYESHTMDGTDFTVLYLPVAFLEYRGIEPDRLAAVAFADWTRRSGSFSPDRGNSRSTKLPGGADSTAPTPSAAPSRPAPARHPHNGGQPATGFRTAWLPEAADPGSRLIDSSKGRSCGPVCRTLCGTLRHLTHDCRTRVAARYFRPGGRF